MTTTDHLELATGPVQCKPWCQAGDGHPEATYLANQGCSLMSEDVPLSRYQSYEVAGGGMHPSFAEVGGYLDPGQAPYLCVSATIEEQGEHYWDMTPDEARALAVQLVRIADTIEVQR